MAEVSSPYDFIVPCLVPPTEHTVQDLRRDIHDERWDWEAVIETASSEMVLPAFCGKIQELGLAPDLPADVSDFFLAVQKLSLERNQRIIAETLRVSRLLNDAGIEPVVLKGVAYLITGVYSDVSARFIADIDLLLPPSLLQRAVEALSRDDYLPGDTNFGHHYFPLRRQKGVWVELHHSLGGGTSRSILPVREVLKNSLRRDLDGVRLRVPSPEHLVTHHILHAQIHNAHNEGIWPSLRTVYDLVSLQKRFGDSINWSSIEARFRLNRRSGALAAHLLLAEHTLAMKTPIPIRMAALTRLRWYHISALRRFPALRWIDPLYLFSRIVIPRARRVGNLLRISAGRRYLLTSPFRASFYLHRIDELLRAFNALFATTQRSDKSAAPSKQANHH